MKDNRSYSSELNKQYSPSYWCKRFPQVVAVEKHVEIVTEASEIALRTIPFEITIYGTRDSCSMNLFGTSLPNGSPIFVYIHGGYWQSLSKDLSCYVVEPLYKAGIKVIVPGYTLAPKATLTEIMEEIRVLAYHVLKEAYKNGVRSVWFGGHSAGAHLAATLLDEKWLNNLEVPFQMLFKGLILISGIYDLTPLIHTEVNDALKLIESEAKLLSPINKNYQTTSHRNPSFTVLLIVAEYDSPQFQQQTHSFNEHLKRFNIKTECILAKGLDHFDVVENLQDPKYFLTNKIITMVTNNR